MTAEKLILKWKEKIPKEVSYQDVLKVAEHFLGSENLRYGKSGSHQLMVYGPITKVATDAKNKGFQILPWLEHSRLTISTVSGKRVKKLYVDRLMQIIDFKIKYDTIHSQEDSK